MLEFVNHELSKEANAGQKYAICQVDLDEGRILQEKYNFLVAPMFIYYMSGKLIAISNSFDNYEVNAKTALQTIQQKHADGCRGNFIDENFKFSADHICNSRLEGIKQKADLLNQAQSQKEPPSPMKVN
eukprot:Rmarinus@m.16750